jgi:ABC-type transport system involved in multi-copper enzyme maturation permease subunit
MTSFRTLLWWEFDKLWRFPLLEIVILVAALAVVQPLRLSVDFSGPPEDIRVAESLASIYVLASLFTLSEGFLLLGAVAAALVVLVFSEEMETAGLRVLLALPLAKKDIFASKVIALFFVQFFVVTVVALFYAVFLDPSSWFAGRLPWLPLWLLPVAVAMLVGTLTSLSVLIAVVAERAVFVFVTSLGLIFVVDVLAKAVTGIYLLPVLLIRLPNLSGPEPSAMVWVSVGLNVLLIATLLVIAYAWFAVKTEA